MNATDSTAVSLPTKAPWALPLLGHALPLVRDPLRFLMSLPAYGNLVEIRIGPHRAIVVCDPSLTHHVLVEDRTFDKGGILYERAREAVGSSLASCPHPEHRQQRRLTQPAFHHTRLADYAPIITAQIAAVTDDWTNEQVIDVPSEMLKITTRVLLATMFSTSFSPTVIAQAMDDLAVLIACIYRRSFLPTSLSRLPTPGSRRYRESISRLRQLVITTIADRQANDTHTFAGRDLVAMLLAARDPESGSRLSETELADQAMGFFLAGVETTASTLSWALYLVSSNSGIENRLQSEVDVVLAGRPADFHDLPELALANRVATETLRLYPPVWLTTRTATVDTRLGGHHISAGTTIVVSPYLIHRQPELYVDPELFNPDRWDRTVGDAPARDAYIPFGGGARKCIGDQFGLAETVLALATITAHWQLQPLPGARVHRQPRTTLRPKALQLRVNPRIFPV
ncbi:cytochrome P450 [Streptomyces olivoreticuli]